MPRVAVIENHALASVTLRKTLMNAIGEAGYELHILTGGSEEFHRAEAMGFAMHDIGSSAQNPVDVTRYLRDLWLTLRRIRPRVCLTYTIRPAIYGNLVCRSLGIPTITNITGIGPLFESKALAYRVARNLYKVAMKHPRTVFFQNDDDREIFISKGLVDEQRAKRIPGSGVDHDWYRPRPRATPDAPMSFLFIGRLVKDKGIGEYVEAARIVRRTHPEFEFRVLGPLWDQNMRRKYGYATGCRLLARGGLYSLPRSNGRRS